MCCVFPPSSHQQVVDSRRHHAAVGDLAVSSLSSWPHLEVPPRGGQDQDVVAIDELGEDPDCVFKPSGRYIEEI